MKRPVMKHPRGVCLAVILALLIGIFLFSALAALAAWDPYCRSCMECSSKLDGTYSRVILSEDIVIPAPAPGTLLPYTCIYFYADHVTFDCSGHTINGNGNTMVGIYAEEKKGIRIENCVLKGFKGSGYIEKNNNVRGFGAIRLDYTDDSAIERNWIEMGPMSTEMSDGIWLEYSSGNLVKNNSLFDAGWMGIAALYESNNNLISGNWVTGSKHYGIASCVKIGEGGKQGNSIVDNIMVNGLDGGMCL